MAKPPERSAFPGGHPRASFPLLAAQSVHYLDSAATSIMPDVVIEAMREFETTHRSNVHGGVHRLARAAIEDFEGARRAVAGLLNAADAREVVFTYGATSSINLLAQTLGETMAEGDEIVLSVLEHHSNLLPWQRVARLTGAKLRFIPITADGRMDLDGLSDVVTERCRLIAVTHCSNVTGAVTDIGRIVAAARAVGAQVMIDGAQRIPHGPVDVQAMDVDYYVFSGHKTFGPTGIGVLWGRYALLDALPPFMVGGQMIDRVTLDGATFAPPPRRFEAGTPPIGGAIGLGAAATWMRSIDWPAARARHKHLTGRILAGLARHDGLRILGPTDLEERQGVVSFVVSGVGVMDLCGALDRRDVAVRCGEHCAQPLMAALGAKQGAARASLALYNTDDDIDALLDALPGARLGARA